MATKPTQCLRALQRQSHFISQAQANLRRQTLRTFVTTSRTSIELPGPNATPSTSLPPVTPVVGEGEAKQSTISTRDAAAELRKLTGRATETYTAYGVTENLVKQCSAQADYQIPQALNNEEMPKTADGEDLGQGSGWWHIDVGLAPTFSTWSQVTMLHMYLLSARFRCFPAEHSQVWQQHLLDHFFYDAENRMTISHNMHARGTRNKYLKDLFIQWRGVNMAYDEGLYKGDAVLASAVWRNVFKADENVDITKLAAIVSFMRKAARALDALPDESVVKGQFKFPDPAGEASVVGVKSRMLDLPLKEKTVINEPVVTS